MSNRAACDSCLHLTKIATLGQGTSDLGPNSVVAVSSNGYLVSSLDKTQVIEYSKSGEQLRIMGRKGAGPGEFELILAIAIDRFDTAYVADISRRVAVLSPDRRYVRQMTFNGNFSGYALLDGRGFVGHAKTDGALETVSFAGARTQVPLTPRPVALTPRCRQCEERWITDAGGSFLASRRNRYVVERISPSGNILSRFHRSPPWFREWSEVPPGVVGVGRPFLNSVGPAYQFGNDTIWTVILIPPAEWQRSATERRPGTAADLARNIDTMIEVVTDSGTLVASQRFRGLMALLPGRLIYAYRDDGDRVVIDLYRPFILPTPGRDR
ncbi:MAG: hypothetical protein ACT4OZ_02875 [Gemmatimonadota bacterium]